MFRGPFFGALLLGYPTTTRRILLPIVVSSQRSDDHIRTHYASSRCDSIGRGEAHIVFCDCLIGPTNLFGWTGTRAGRSVFHVYTQCVYSIVSSPRGCQLGKCSLLSFLCAIKKLWIDITKRTSPEQTEKIDPDWEWRSRSDITFV
jgi:hypothetical protein